MNAMATTHKRNWLVGGEHILSAYRTITLGAPLDTLMCTFSLYRHTSSTLLAMEKVFA